MREALPWLSPRLEPSESRRYAAVLVCRELASEAPAVFNVHVASFLDGVWGGLRDTKLHVREARVQALEVRRTSRGTAGVSVAHEFGGGGERPGLEQGVCWGSGEVEAQGMFCVHACMHPPMRASVHAESYAHTALRPATHVTFMHAHHSVCWCW